MHCVDLGESFPTSIYLQKSASIQPRTSPLKFGGKYSILFTGVLHLLTKRAAVVSTPPNFPSTATVEFSHEPEWPSTKLLRLRYFPDMWNSHTRSGLFRDPIWRLGEATDTADSEACADFAGLPLHRVVPTVQRVRTERCLSFRSTHEGRGKF